MKSKSRIISIVLVAAVLLTSFPVMADHSNRMGKQQIQAGSQMNTPPEYTFQIEGSDKTFILLESTEGSSYILAKEHYKRGAYDPDDTQRFDIEDPNNIAYWLNHDFLEVDPEDSNKLPEAMLPYLQEHTYPVEPGYVGGNAPDAYEVTAKVVLLSVTEWLKYNLRIGMQDSIPQYGWWLRTGVGENGGVDRVFWSVIYPGTTGQADQQSASNTTGATRPAFRLSDDFFKNIRINLDTVGDAIKDEVFARMSYKELPLYTDTELRFLGVKDVPLRLRVGADSLVGGAYASEAALPFASVAVLTDGASASVTVCTDKGERIPLTAEAVNGEAVFSTAEYGLINRVETDGTAKEVALLMPQQTEGYEVKGGEEKIAALPLRNIDAYEIKMNYSCSGVNNRGGFTVETMALSIDGKMISPWKPLCSDGGLQPVTPRDRTYAVVERDGEAAFILFRTKLTSGSVAVNEFRMEAIEEEIAFEHDWAPLYLLEENGEEMQVKIKTSAVIPRIYTVKGSFTCYIGGNVVEIPSVRVEVKPGEETVLNLKLSSLRYGTGDLEIAVYDGGRKAASFLQKICVYKPYEPHYFDKYSTGDLVGLTAGSLNHLSELTYQEVIDVVTGLGFRSIRSDPHWDGIEKVRGIYDFSSANPTNLRQLWEKNRMDFRPVILAYNNPIYDNIAEYNNKDAIDKPDELQAYVDFATASVLEYDHVDWFELWNEPNGSGFWTSADPYEYASAVKTATSFIHQVRPEANVSAGSIDVSRDGIGYSWKIFGAGIYPFVDTFSVHPYYHPMPGDDVFEDKTRSYMDIVESYGGWKDVDLTEIGWRSNVEGTLDLMQAEEIPKIFPRCEGLGVFHNIFAFIVHYGNDHIFGFVDGARQARPSSASTSNYFNHTGGSEFLFRYQPNDTAFVYCYQRDGKNVVMAWDTNGDTTLSFGKPLEVVDLYGNSKGKMQNVKLEAAQQYIHDVSPEWIREKFAWQIGEEIKKFTEKNDALLSDNAKAQIAELSGKITAAPAKELTEVVYDIGLSMMEEMGESVFDAENTLLLYELHRIGELIIKLYGSQTTEADSTVIGEFEELFAEYNDKLHYNTDKMVFTYDLLRHARREVEELEDLLAEGSATVDTKMFMSNRNLLAKQLMRWVEYTMQKEEVIRLDTTFSMIPAQATVVDGRDLDVEISVFNSTFDNFTGKLEMVNTEGTVVAAVDKVKVAARDHTTVKMSFPVLEDKLNEVMFYTIRYTQGGYASESVYPVTKKPQISVEFENITTPLDQMNAISYKLTNLMADDLEIILNATAPEGWEVQQNITVSLQPNETKVVSVPVQKVHKTAFHHYSIRLEILRDDGYLIYDETELMNFAVSTRADKEIVPAEFSGDLSDWSNAYPYYIALPEDYNSGESWKNSEQSGRVFSKWDDENLYFMVDVYDETHSNMKSGETIWDGDAVQIAFDVLDTNSGAYDNDDYEIAAALTAESGIQVWTHASGSRGINGERPADWSGIVRDEENRTTRYLLKIPKTDITPFEMKLGSSISMDLALADSDLLSTRETSVSICGTITTRKDTVPFIRWYLVGTQEALTEGMEEIEKIFPTH